MRNLTVAMQTHIAGAVTTLACCLEITRNDGVTLRMTEHDRDITINGVVYKTGATFNMSAIKSAADLSVDNASIEIGVGYGAQIQKTDFDKNLLRRAPFRLFSVNWMSPESGVIELKRGWIGDVTRRTQDFVTLALRGLTQALQKNILEQYSPTCRADFGDKRCGYAVSPTRLRRAGALYKVGDWVVQPKADTLTNILLTNGNFDLGNTSSWTPSGGASWTVNHAPTGYYLQGDTPSLSPGAVQALSQRVSATGSGMSTSFIDGGKYLLSFGALVSTPSSVAADKARVRVTFESNSGAPLGEVASEWVQTVYGRLEEARIGAFVPPNTRWITFSLDALVSGNVVNATFRSVVPTFTSTMPSFIHKLVRIPTFSTSEAVPFTNTKFSVDGSGTVLSGWTESGYSAVTSQGSLTPPTSAYFAYGSGNMSQKKDVTVAATSSFRVTVKRGHLLSTDSSRVTVNFYDAANAVTGTISSSDLHTALLNTWEDVVINGAVPPNTKSMEIVLSNTVGNTAWADVAAFIMSSVVPNASDNKRGYSSESQALAFSDTVATYTTDGDLQWLAVAAPFGTDVVSAVSDNRVFVGTAIDSSAASDFYSGPVLWLSGANAGTISYIRTWVPSTKTLKLYAPCGSNIGVGDRFLYCYGCNKVVDDCKTRFQNTINFRGEPYLPGTERALQFIAQTTA